ncbi:aminotransferase class V-fold PLP-dependent enzyme [uncultured Ilyobacter sp.]|uniref:aminotransferase class V-fold PLP-dependent enzyme n=1 Tax=uncultured Ilyobacter sp. TaxID=544433 RepID=UPI0029F4A323|nr:aminotransferase class V-fold PLP-dependent enzyme [uncultured Ilyobacter sp.]
MIYFDNAATTFPKPKEVYNETMSIYQDLGLNFSRNSSSKSKEASTLKENLKSNIQQLLSSKGEVILNPSATFSLNEIIFGLDYSGIKTVYISPFEHNAVYRSIKEAQKRYKFDLEIIKFQEYSLDYEDLELKFLSKKPDLIICLHASNVFGNILSIKNIFSKGREYSATTLLDASQTAGLLDFSELSSLCDFIVFAGHKTLYGPSGIGGYIYNNKNIKLNPLLYGGTGIKSEETDMPKDIPERYESGSPNLLGIIGLKISTDWIIATGRDKVLKKEKENYSRLLAVLEEFEWDISIFYPENSVGIISITAKNSSPQEIEMMLNDSNVSVRTGMHCSPLAHKHMGTDEKGTIRFSVSYFNENSDFEKLEEVFEDIF